MRDFCFIFIGVCFLFNVSSITCFILMSFIEEPACRFAPRRGNELIAQGNALWYWSNDAINNLPVSLRPVE